LNLMADLVKRCVSQRQVMSILALEGDVTCQGEGRCHWCVTDVGGGLDPAASPRARPSPLAWTLAPRGDDRVATRFGLKRSGGW
jgi:ferredoxin